MASNANLIDTQPQVKCENNVYQKIYLITAIIVFVMAKKKLIIAKNKHKFNFYDLILKSRIIYEIV